MASPSSKNVPKMEKKVKFNPFETPTQEQEDYFKNLNEKHLCQDAEALGKLDICQGTLRRSLRPQTPKLGWRADDQDGRSEKRIKRLLPVTGREFLWSVQETAKEKYISGLMKKEALRVKNEVAKDEMDAFKYEQQLKAHQRALEMFLSNHYAQVSNTINKRDETDQRHKDLDERLDYFSGLLKAAQTVQEEENERLQELTAFQHFIAAVTPQQSLRDLLRRLKQSKEEKEIAAEDEEQKTLPVEERDSSKPVGTKGQRARSARMGPMSSVGVLRSEVLAMRMIDPEDDQELQITEKTTPETASSVVQSPAASSEVTSLKGVDDDGMSVESKDFDPHLFDPYLDDPSYLLKLAEMYENQCHSLLALLTRLGQQKDSLEKDIKHRQENLEYRLLDLHRLHEPSGHVGESYVKNMKKIITGWDHLVGDKDAKQELALLAKQISEVVSDIFGSSNLLSIMKPPATNNEEQKDDSDEVHSAGIGHGALLTLLESRATDLCSQLLIIPKEIRDPIFKKCEKERKLRLEEEARQKEEMLRALRRKQHLERALESPPPRPI